MTTHSNIELILHPGHAKCGSTSLQESIYRNRHLLFNQGICVPNRRFEIDIAQMTKPGTWNDAPNNYLDEIVKYGNVDGFHKALLNAIVAVSECGARRLLISAEVLSGFLNLDSMRAIHQFLANSFSKVTVIYYIRRQDDFLLSAWQQWEHKIGCLWPDYIEDSLQRKRINYTYITDYLIRTYGFDSLTVRPLSPCALIDGNLVRDFSVRAGLQLPDDTVAAEYANVGLHAGLCDVLSRIHSIYKNVHDQEVKNTLLSVTRHPELFTKRQTACLSDSLRRRIMKAYRKDNKKLHTAFFRDVKFEDVFGFKSNKDSDIAQLRAELDSVKDVLAMTLELCWNLVLKRGCLKEESPQSDWK